MQISELCGCLKENEQFANNELLISARQLSLFTLTHKQVVVSKRQSEELPTKCIYATGENASRCKSCMNELQTYFTTKTRKRRV